ncbi:clr-1 [Rasamsonia emersonii CBS 393.64]|uniref:Clr-1 n=1 Tax=Rasamsonia emersonii (strain ATCC 16479 / CBS 393.64 / IMI 116815) TaxID=1408163 RepID=A0A0F4YL86_RASE3|nr:clr-1 [Rasamsonia emersonii CBS 393.64]KKA18870.1 clr-1 [Rasamsonia emersonii CBS 393.64]
MEVVATDDKPKPIPAYGAHPPQHPSAPAHPSVQQRIAPPAEASHALPSSHALYEQSWRPYASPFDAANPDQRRQSTPAQPPLPAHSYPPPPPNRELPQLPPDVNPYARPNSLPAPAPTHSPQDGHPQHPQYRPMNGAPPNEPVPQSAPGDYRPRMAYPPPEGAPNNGEPPPPSGQYVPNVSHMPATTGPYDSSYYHSQMFGRQRKAARAQQACDQCRARKAKCDEGRPSCTHCKENGLVCVYKEVPPHKQEKATQLVLDKLQQLEERMSQQIEQRMAQMQAEQMAQIKKLLGQQAESPAAAETPAKDTSIPKAPQSHESSVERPVTNVETQSTPSQSEIKDDGTPTAMPAAPQKFEMAGGDMANDVMIKDEDDGELSIPVEHTTAAHKLLLWPSIRRLLAPKEIDEDYVMKLEEERGLIRVYGRGEGDDRSDYERGAASSPSTTNSSSPNWEEDYHTQGASPNGPWGTGLPATTSSTTSHRPREGVGGLDETGQLNTDPDVVRRLHRSYMQHIHILHPFLDESNLERKIERFIRIYSPPKKNVAGPFMPPGNPGDGPRGAKRKRSSEALHVGGYDMSRSPGSNSERAAPRRIERSIENAIILLVLALGAICEWRDRPLPGPVKDYPPGHGPSSSALQNVLSPAMSDSGMQSSSAFCSPTNNSFPSPDGGEARKPTPGRSAFAAGQENSEFAHPRNMDVIPGLAYYAYATDILGNLQGGNGLYHVQAALLAGLYAGQLAHPFQSHGWISQASRACQVLVRSKRYEKMQDGPMKDLCDFAYWTCLQLESDILAELDLPASGISRSEGRIALPKGVFTLSLPNEIRAPNTMMMFFYSAQIHLRKVLNRVHTDLYKAEKKGQTRWSFNVLEVLSMNLEFWRKSLPDVMKWDDRDPPASDINTARMRAKYYGARYIIHRPVLCHVLHYMSPAQSTAEGAQSQQVSPSMAQGQRAPGMARWSSDMGNSGRPNQADIWPGVAFKDLHVKLQRACKICIESAIQSTEAFDGIKGRLIVTNIFGTAHALRADAEILTEIYKKIFGEPPNTTYSLND